MSKPFNAPGMTKWTNPIGRPVAKLHLYKHPPVIIPNPAGVGLGTVKDTGFLDAEIKPGEDCYLPSGYDDAICRKDENGIVQSGCCPWLERNDEPSELHPSLDPIEQQRLQGEIEIERARVKAAEAENERFKAEQLKADAERQQRENEARAKADQEAREQLAADRAEVAKLKAELLKQKAEQDKALEQLTKPAADVSSGAGGDSGKSDGKQGGGKAGGGKAGG